jgi:D-aminopeptidase
MTDDDTRRHKPRLRDLGITIGVLPPGPLNAVTDVSGVRVGHATVIHGEGPRVVGQGPARTGVTAIHPHEGSAFARQVPAAIQILNGAGEITGRSQVDEFGILETPILITNTLSVGEVHRGAVDWLVREHPGIGSTHFVIPVVAETYDGFLNDAAGQHVTREHVFHALDSATDGPVVEGNVGGGTGMSLFGFKGGIGTSSRRITIDDETFTVGVLVQGNFGDRPSLLVDGVPVGREITDLQAVRGGRPPEEPGDGSVIVVIGTDLPLSDRQLGRLAKRGMLGLGRVGANGHHFSGDLLLAFSNAPACRIDRFAGLRWLGGRRLADTAIDVVFRATIEATSESVLNAMVAAETMTGADGNILYALPHDRLREVMRKYGRLHEEA